MPAHILVVDDNPINLKLACDVLEACGYEIERAQDAERALDVVKKKAPDLILMDIELPGMDGLTLTRTLKGDEATKGIAIIALTAYAMKGDDQKALQAGCDAYISKPIDTRNLPLQVAEILNKRSL